MSEQCGNENPSPGGVTEKGFTSKVLYQQDGWPMMLMDEPGLSSLPHCGRLCANICAHVVLAVIASRAHLFLLRLRFFAIAALSISLRSLFYEKLNVSFPQCETAVDTV